MVLQANERCENCLKHPFEPFHIVTEQPDRCDRCLSGDRTLQRCGKCHIVRYCVSDDYIFWSSFNNIIWQSKVCQTAHWSLHKQSCEETARSTAAWDRLPWNMAERHRTHRRWSEKHQDSFTAAGIKAMRLWVDRKQIGSILQISRVS